MPDTYLIIKDLIPQMLCADTDRRLSADDVFNYLRLVEDLYPDRYPPLIIDPAPSNEVYLPVRSTDGK